jgi:NAD(P)-dependent dehydrogenase (short-subunit alcohol dehydrogenase family)
VEEVRRLAAEATAVLGHIDILVNNAGTGFWGTTEQTDEATFDALIATNVKGPFYLTAALAPQMAQRGSGKIINITSVVGHLGRTGLALYGATKAALTLLTRSWAAEFGPKGVNVNAIAPGPTRTPGTSDMDFDQFVRRLPAGRAALPADMAEAAVYLASDEANFVHGVTLPIDGGGTAV